MRPRLLSLAVHLAIVVGATTGVAVAVVPFLDGPILAPNDLGAYRFTSFYFSQNLTWLPWPRLSLLTDWTLFPYGNDHTLLVWSFERDFFYSILYRWLGSGPWYQLYFLGSLAGTAVLGYLILLPGEGPLRASLASLAVSFGNFYALAKFPGHMGLSTVHWMTLGILLDFVLVRRHWQGESWSAPWIFARGIALVASLGLELGYIAGVGLTSFLAAVAWMAAVELYRRSPAAAVRRLFTELKASATARPVTTSLLGVGLALYFWLLVPLTLQIASAALAFDFPGGFVQHEHPLRILLPIVPGLDPRNVAPIAGIRGENFGFHFRPGLTFVILGVAGLVAARRRLPIAVPFLAVLAALVSFDPETFAHLKALPWFSYARAPGRLSAAFPALFVAIFLASPGDAFRARKRWRVAAGLLLAGLAAVEATTAYREIASAPSVSKGVVKVQGDLRHLLRTIRETPGEGLFEWPFAVLPRGGRLGTYSRQLGHTPQLAEFHGKKVMGFFSGRYHPGPLVPLERAGWPGLFLPECRGPRTMALPRRDFVEEEWEFLTGFVRRADIAGILLYTRFLPAETVAGFHRRFGQPVASARFPATGLMEFIPTPEGLRGGGAGPVRDLRLQTPTFPLPAGEAVQVDRCAAEDWLRQGWSPPQSGFRWTDGRRATIEFSRPHLLPARFQLHGRSEGPQRVVVHLNGSRIGEWQHEGGRPATRSISLPTALLEPRNTLTLELPDAEARDRFRGAERLLGLQVRWIRLQPAE